MKTRIRQLTEQERRSLGEQQMIADWLKIFPSCHQILKLKL